MSYQNRCRFTAVALSATALAATIALAPVASGDPATTGPAVGTYVALGDSFAAGPGMPPFDNENCERSQHNYGHLVARALGVARYTDVTCGGAVTESLSTAQKTGVAPQLDSVSPDTDLITVTLGGNDAGFIEVLTTCGVLGLASVVPDPCRTYYTRTGVDELARRLTEDVAPKLQAAFDAIRARAPHAVIIATTYPHIFPESGQCWPAIPFAAGDMPWLAAVQRSLNAMIAAAATRADALVADVFANSAEHNACQPAEVRWVEPLNGAVAAPAHPNHTGMAEIAAAVLSTARSAGLDSAYPHPSAPVR
ncbi:SGNH/GDSL hydrolase family protein [Nocardia fusca]|uniref:SGNH/GDSL hydrolase family protein n=1 Tax=Nocardia fusca TaxID=941183 RepID=A0ABV3FGL4_9NOCA